MQRREFLKQSTTAAMAASLAGPMVHASDKAGSKPPIIGKGEHTYECHHYWGEVPAHVKWFETHGVAVDREGLVYIKHRGGATIPKSVEDGQDTIVVFDPSGKFVRSFGKAYHAGGHGIDVREENGQEYLYLSCMMPVNLFLKTDLKGEVVWLKKRDALAPSHLYDDEKAPFRPTNIAFAPDGGFYLADGYGSNLIHQFDRDAGYVRSWGGTGTEPGQFRTPHGLWLDNRPGHDPMIVVADRANARLQYFTTEGKLVRVEGNVSFPAHFDIRGEVLLVPDLHARLTLLDGNNQVIDHLGYDPEWTKKVLDGMKMRSQPETWGAAEGRFLHPHDACFDKDGNIYVAEWVATGRISFLRKV